MVGHAAALGTRIRVALTDGWSEGIGVVADLHDDGVEQKAPAIAYWPLLRVMDSRGAAGAGDTGGAARAGTAASAPALGSQRSIAFVVRTSRAGSAALIDELRQAVWRINPNLPLTDVMTAQARSIDRWRAPR